MHSQHSSGVSRRDLLRMGAAGLAGICAGAARFPTRRFRSAFSCTRCATSVRGTCPAPWPLLPRWVTREWSSPAITTATRALRKLLDDNGLKCCGTHIGLETLMGDKLAQTVEFNRTLGNKFLVVPGLAPERTKSRQSWRETAKIFGEISARLKPEGMRVGYHNHSIEFQPLDGEMPWDTFFGNTPKEVIMQVDVGNALDAGADPVAFIRKYPGRAATIHVKEYSKANPKAYVGEGDVNWKDVFGLLENTGGTEWYIVEYEVDGVPPVEGVAAASRTCAKWESSWPAFR